MTLKVYLHFVQDTRRFVLNFENRNSISIQIVNPKLIGTEVGKYVHIFYINPSFPCIHKIFQMISVNFNQVKQKNSMTKLGTYLHIYVSIF